MNYLEQYIKLYINNLLLYISEHYNIDYYELLEYYEHNI